MENVKFRSEVKQLNKYADEVECQLEQLEGKVEHLEKYTNANANDNNKEVQAEGQEGKAEILEWRVLEVLDAMHLNVRREDITRIIKATKTMKKNKDVYTF